MRTLGKLACLGLAALAGSALAADAPADPSALRIAMLEKRLYFLQQRLNELEHELSTRPRSEAAAEAWRNDAAWHQLRLGMSQADVLRILGAPGRTTTYYGFQRWEYPDALGKRVDFDESGQLISWPPLAR